MPRSRAVSSPSMSPRGRRRSRCQTPACGCPARTRGADVGEARPDRPRGAKRLVSQTLMVPSLEPAATHLRPGSLPPPRRPAAQLLHCGCWAGPKRSPALEPPRSARPLRSRTPPPSRHRPAPRSCHLTAGLLSHTPMIPPHDHEATREPSGLNTACTRSRAPSAQRRWSSRSHIERPRRPPIIPPSHRHFLSLRTVQRRCAHREPRDRAAVCGLPQFTFGVRVFVCRPSSVARPCDGQRVSARS